MKTEFNDGAVRWRFEQIYLKPGHTSDIKLLVARMPGETCHVEGAVSATNSYFRVIVDPLDVYGHAMVTRLIALLLEGTDFMVMTIDHMKEQVWVEIQTMMGGEIKNIVMSEIGRLVDTRTLESMLHQPNAMLTLDISSPMIRGGEETSFDIPLLAAYECMIHDGRVGPHELH